MLRFVLRLALRLGKTLAEIADMSWSELQLWAAYYQLEPWGEERGDLRAGIIASTIANVYRDASREPFSPLDFMPDFAEDRGPQPGRFYEPKTVQEAEALVRFFLGIK
jgi:hypothetical protein